MFEVRPWGSVQGVTASESRTKYDSFIWQLFKKLCLQQITIFGEVTVFYFRLIITLFEMEKF